MQTRLLRFATLRRMLPAKTRNLLGAFARQSVPTIFTAKTRDGTAQGAVAQPAYPEHTE
jgi:hypothetical protein